MFPPSRTPTRQGGRPVLAVRSERQVTRLPTPGQGTQTLNSSIPGPLEKFDRSGCPEPPIVRGQGEVPSFCLSTRVLRIDTLSEVLTFPSFFAKVGVCGSI